jgi:hypothetical protein
MTMRSVPFRPLTLHTRGAVSLLATGALLFSSQFSLAQFTQQGPKLTDVTAPGAGQGQSVALSGDGNTALVGGPQDHDFLGAAWVYVRNNSVWVQQGSKLLGNNAIGDAVAQGWSVALSGGGNTALVGGTGDSGPARGPTSATRHSLGYQEPYEGLLDHGGARARGAVYTAPIPYFPVLNRQIR